MTTDFDIANHGFSVRPAGLVDLKACRMLVGEFPQEADWYVAVDRVHGLAIGAAAAAHALRTTPVVGPGVAIHVIAPCRRRGVGRALVRALDDGAKFRGWRALYSAQRVLVDGDEFRAWQGLGFGVVEKVEEHELPLDQFEPLLAPLVSRLQKSGRIPAEARIVPLYSVDPGAVMQLHLDHMGGERGTLYQKLRGQGVGAFHPRYSRVLLLGERVAGCILAHRKSPTVAAVDATILIPEVRGGWANVWLKLEATQGALSLGITHFHFTSFDHYADTRRFTDRLGGVTTKVWALMHRELGD